MVTSKFNFWQRWLFICSCIVILFGLFMTFLNATALYDIVINNQYEPVFWGEKSLPDNAKLFQQWVYGAWGATIVGWGIIVAFIVQYPFKRKERWSWIGLVIMTSVWYLFDTGVSVIYRVYANVILNTFIGVFLSIPLIFTRKDCINKIS